MPEYLLIEFLPATLDEVPSSTVDSSSCLSSIYLDKDPQTPADSKIRRDRALSRERANEIKSEREPMRSRARAREGDQEREGANEIKSESARRRSRARARARARKRETERETPGVTARAPRARECDRENARTRVRD